MMSKVQYVINEQGEQIGVLLDLEEYRRLTHQLTIDPDLIPGLSQAELQALAESMLAPEAQVRLNKLLARQKEKQLSAEELDSLDHLLEQVDQLTLLKTRARYTLTQLGELAAAA